MKQALVRFAAAAGLIAGAAMVPAAAPLDPLALAKSIQTELAALRSLPFKQAVAVEKQTPEGLGRHMDEEADDAVSPAMARHFDKIVRRLGLYRGPEIDDFRSMIRAVMTSQVAAYYDPDTKGIYILYEGADELEQGFVYAHELYHALQDQYFDLNGYLADDLKLDSDQTLARMAVVEGEATYMGVLWTMQKMMNGVPPRAMIAPAIAMQADMEDSALRAMIGESGGDADAMADVPPFILETLVGSYMKGMAFVFAVQEQGWPAVEKLYREYPPQSTEQILHPEKWLARENPVRFKWPDLGKERALRNWELIDEDVVGEVQWRIILKENGATPAAAASAAAGWNGDRYAVLKRKGSDETLLLLRTSWDSEAEAKQFVEAYQSALSVKYQGQAEPTVVEQRGSEVFIVEGGRQADQKALLTIVGNARTST